MNVQAMLAHKGDRVVTARPESTIATIIHVMKVEGIGAVVISRDGRRIDGIVSERDVVRGLVAHGGDLLALPVTEIMTEQVRTCDIDANVEDVMVEMTRSRIRHLPVTREGKLCGIVSIGDVVKNRLDDLETETSVLRDYIVGRA
jgi:CBS domain-containing protein